MQRGRTFWKAGVPWAATLLASGCVSGATWRTIDDLERRIREVSEADEASGANEAGPARGASEVSETSGGGLASELGAPDRDGGPARGAEIAPFDCGALARQAIRLSPGLRAPIERARAAAARARSELSLPAPEVALEVWDFPIGAPQRADREGMYMVDVGQHVVPGAVLEGRARAEAALALAELAEADERARAIREEVHHACIEWASAALRRDRIERSRELVGRMVELISARRTVTGEPLAELARLELERARIDRWSAEADADVERARLTLAALLGRDLPGDPPPLGPSLEPVDIQAMERRALASRGLVRASRARREAARARAEAAEAEATIPSFLLRATFMQMPSARPGLGAMIAVDLPWLWGGEGARSEAARAEVRAEEDEIAWREREIRIALARAAADLRRAQRRLAALRERERPAAERALESATIGYAAGRADLIGWLEALGVLRALDLEEAEALAEVAHARAALEAIVGRRTDPGGTR